MIAENLQLIRENIMESSAKRLPSERETVTLIAVTKNHSADNVDAAIVAGITDIGENRIQEAKEKFPQIISLNEKITRHLIGHLQTNKAKDAVRLFDLIHSVDSEKLALAVNEAAGKIGKVQDILLQVNLAKETSKGGVYPENLAALEQTVENLPNLRWLGFMLMAPAYDDPESCRPLFRDMYNIFRETKVKLENEKYGKKENLSARANIKYLSMGMSHDYRIAVEEGANMVRIGTAIFGQRQY